jgi:hypothetical protein
MIQPAFKDPTCRVHEGRWSYSSCADESKFSYESDPDTDEDEDEDEDEGSQPGGKGKKQSDFSLDELGLVKYFTHVCHYNLPRAVFEIMWNENVQVTCSRCVLVEDDPYWTTGEVADENRCEIDGVSPMRVCSAGGHLEQLLSAGLASLYKNGARNRVPSKDAPHFYAMGYRAKESKDDIQVHFKFNGQRACLQLFGDSPFREVGGRCIHLAAGSW